MTDSPKVTIYSTPTCGFCHMAKQWMDENNISYKDNDVTTSQSLVQEMVEKSGQMGVPVIEIEDKILVGFDKHRMEELLLS